MDRRLRVLIVGPTPPPYHGGTVATRHLLDSTLRDRFELVHADTSDRRDLRNVGRADLENVRLAFVHGLRFLGLLVARRPDVVYVPLAQNRLGFLRDCLFLLPARLLGKPVVVHIHGGGFGRFRAEAGPVLRALIRWAVGRVWRAIVLGERLRPMLDGLVPADRVAVVPNGIPDPGRPPRRAGIGDDDGAATVAASSGGLSAAGSGGVAAAGSGGRAAAGSSGVAAAFEGDDGQITAAAPANAADSAQPTTKTAPGTRAGAPIRVAYLGTLTRSKGFLDVLAAAALLRDERPDLRFVLAGDYASAEDEAAGTRAAAEPAERVRLAGLVTGEAKARLLWESDIFAFPTYYPLEGHPLVILEAMAAGLPVIATDHGAIAEMVTDGETGRLVPPRDPAALAAAIRELADDAALRERMGRAARARFEAEFGVERWADRLGEVLASAARAG